MLWENRKRSHIFFQLKECWAWFSEDLGARTQPWFLLVLEVWAGCRMLWASLPICTLTGLPCRVSMKLKSGESENVKSLWNMPRQYKRLLLVYVLSDGLGFLCSVGLSRNYPKMLSQEFFTEIGVVAYKYQPSEDQSFYNKQICVFLSNQIIFFFILAIFWNCVLLVSLNHILILNPKDSFLKRPWSIWDRL